MFLTFANIQLFRINNKDIQKNFSTIDIYNSLNA